MNTFFKNKLVTVLILAATIILAGVAIFTAIRLYQLRQEAVAPTAPESKPRAAAVPEACRNLVFTLSTTEASCTISTNPTSVNLTAGETKTITATTTGLTKAQAEKIDVASADGLKVSGDSKLIGCIEKDSGKIECTFKVKGEASTGDGSVNVTLASTGTPSCSTTVKVSVSGGTGGGEPNSCGGTCGSNSNCKSGLFCYQGSCRNPSCPSDTDCNCPTTGGGSTATAKPTAKATATPTEAPSLPESGTGWPTVVGVGVGAILIIGAILLAL